MSALNVLHNRVSPFCPPPNHLPPTTQRATLALKTLTESLRLWTRRVFIRQNPFFTNETPILLAALLARDTNQHSNQVGLPNLFSTRFMSLEFRLLSFSHARSCRSTIHSILDEREGPQDYSDQDGHPQQGIPNASCQTERLTSRHEAPRASCRYHTAKLPDKTIPKNRSSQVGLTRTSLTPTAASTVPPQESTLFWRFSLLFRPKLKTARPYEPLQADFSQHHYQDSKLNSCRLHERCFGHNVRATSSKTKS